MAVPGAVRGGCGAGSGGAGGGFCFRQRRMRSRGYFAFFNSGPPVRLGFSPVMPLGLKRSQRWVEGADPYYLFGGGEGEVGREEGGGKGRKGREGKGEERRRRWQAGDEILLSVMAGVNFHWLGLHKVLGEESVRDGVPLCVRVRAGRGVRPARAFSPGFPPEPPGRNGAAAALTAQGWSRSGRPRLPLGVRRGPRFADPLPAPPAPSLRSDHNNNNNGGGERGGRRAAGRGAAEEFGSFPPFFLDIFPLKKKKKCFKNASGLPSCTHPPSPPSPGLRTHRTLALAQLARARSGVKTRRARSPVRLGSALPFPCPTARGPPAAPRAFPPCS